MWSPTHIQVTVQRAKGLLVKGKNNTNNCFVTIGLGKEKYQTSVKDKSDPNVSWNEECELKIPDQGNRAELVLTCLHRNNLGIDEFLGQITLPLNEMDVYDRPRSKWFKLESKPGKEKKNKDRGELEVRISFNVKSGSMTDLSKKEKLKSSKTSVGGSLLSINTLEKRKSLKKFAKSLGSKMHLSSKKKNKDGDDISINGSYGSISTPNDSNSGGRQYGQRAGEADPGVISEDEDEFVFDNLSHKSSGSSLNVRANGSLQPPTQNYTPRNPSPLLNTTTGGKLSRLSSDVNVVIDTEMEASSNEYSIDTRTLPPPSKPPRTPHSPSISEQSIIANYPKLPSTKEAESPTEPELNEWEKKLYGSKSLDIGSSNSLKRRSWEYRVPLKSTSEEINSEEEKENSEQPKKTSQQQNTTLPSLHDSNTSLDSDISLPDLDGTKVEIENIKAPEKAAVTSSRILPLQMEASLSKETALNINLLSPDLEQSNFDQFNATFAKYEQKNSAVIFNTDINEKRNSRIYTEQDMEIPSKLHIPKAMPRNHNSDINIQCDQLLDKQIYKTQTEVSTLTTTDEITTKSGDCEDKLSAKKLVMPIMMKEEKKHTTVDKEEETLRANLQEQEEEQRRNAKHQEEDQKILNFVKRPAIVEDKDNNYNNQENCSTEKLFDDTLILATNSGKRESEKRIGKYKYLNKRDDNLSSPKTTERIIIGHERRSTHAERRSEITAALTRKYEGKSREELMLIANGMENEALVQRQRVKELEDYLDNLLLRVMETHPKILQNPYSRTTSAKSG